MCVLNKIEKIYFFCFAAIFFLSCNNSGEDFFNKEKSSCSKNFVAETLFYDGENREYILFIPENYKGTSAVPVVFNFHGNGEVASDYMMRADMRAAAQANPFILVYPQGSCLNGSTHWNPCPIGEDNKSDTDDIGFFESLLQVLSASYNVDSNRVYAVGYSNGGMMAYGLAHYKSNLIAGVASVSGVMLDCTGTPQHPMPVLHLHGTSDPVIPYQGNNYYASVDQVINHWVGFNNTVTDPIIQSYNSAGMRIEHAVYDQGDRGVAVEHYKYIGGEHLWFETTVEGQNTASLIWNFLSQYDLKGRIEQ